MDVLHQLDRNGQLLRCFIQLVLAQVLYAADLRVHRAHMGDGLNDIARARFALGANHACALCDAAERFAQITRAANERHVELGLVDVVNVVGGGEDLTLVDVVDLDRLEDLRLYEMTDAALRHDRDGNGLLNAADHAGVAHAGYAAGRTDVRRDALERHDCASAGFLCNLCLLRSGNVHDDAALEHLRQFLVEFVTCSHFIVLLSDYRSLL